MSAIELQQIKILVRSLIKIALRLHMPKHRLQDMISAEYDAERDNLRSPQ